MSGDAAKRLENGIEAALVAGVSAIDPVAGAAAAGFLAAGGGAHIKRWFLIADEVFDDAGRSLDVNDPQLVAAYWILANGAAQTSREAKWRYLAIALVNSGSWSANPDFIVEHFANLASRYSPEHVQILGILETLEDDAQTGHRTPPLTRDGLLQEIRDLGAASEDFEFIIEVVLDELIRDGLVSAHYSAAFEQALTGEEPAGSPYTLSATGRRFHRHLTQFPV